MVVLASAINAKRANNAIKNHENLAETAEKKEADRVKSWAAVQASKHDSFRDPDKWRNPVLKLCVLQRCRARALRRFRRRPDRAPPPTPLSPSPPPPPPRPRLAGT